jgi:hypothetical protein
LNETCARTDFDNFNTFDGYCPFITSSNVTRCGLNRSCTFAFALKNNRTVFQIPATYKSKHVSSSLFPLRDDTTGRVCMLLELVVGMPVSSTKNTFSIGVANGTLGTVAGIQWSYTTSFETFFTPEGVTVRKASEVPEYVFLHPLSPITQSFGDLPLGIIPISPTKTKVELKLANRKFSHTVNQIALVPAFAITTDKSQGLTVAKAVIGPQKDAVRKSPPPQILYVALSRAINPNYMRLLEPVTVALLSSFKPSAELLAVDFDLRSRSVPEFY